jgi:hypothetical protein
VTADPIWWPRELEPDEMVEGGLEFVRLLRRAGNPPSPELLAWIARRDAQRDFDQFGLQ